MTLDSWILDRIEVDVSGFFTTHHHFQSEVGALGEFTLPAFSQQGTFQAADGRELVMRKPSWLGSRHELLDGETARGTADRRRWFSLGFVIQFDGREYTLEPEGLFSRSWFLDDAEGNTLLEIQPRGVFRQGAYLTIKGTIDADLVAFAYYLVFVRQREAAAAAAAS